MTTFSYRTPLALLLAAAFLAGCATRPVPDPRDPGVVRGTPVLIRGDVDCDPGDKVGDRDIRLRSMRETLEFGRSRGWKQVIFGHRGRKKNGKPVGTLADVARRLGEILGCEVPLVADWLDEAAIAIQPHAKAAIQRAAAGCGVRAWRPGVAGARVLPPKVVAGDPGPASIHGQCWSCR